MFRLLKFLYIHSNMCYQVRHLWSCLESVIQRLRALVTLLDSGREEKHEFLSVPVTTWWHMYYEEGDPCVSVMGTAGLLLKVQSLLKWRVEPRECPIPSLAGSKCYPLQIDFGHWGQICNSSLVFPSGSSKGMEVWGLSGSFLSSLSCSPRCLVSVLQFPKYGKDNTVLP